MSIHLGVIADDFTGATDVAGALAKEGLRVLLAIDRIDSAVAHDVDAIVIALKSRTAATTSAVSQSLMALGQLRAQGARQIFFKYCSTFDSTAEGNIGPVAKALLTQLRANCIVFAPTFPDNGRTVYQGHLFVGTKLLSDSSMRHHPLTPMRDSSLVRLLQEQVAEPVGLIDLQCVHRGSEAITKFLRDLKESGLRFVIVDAVDADDLDNLALAIASEPLVTGATGLAGALARAWISPKRGDARGERMVTPYIGGHEAIIAGSCSQTTLAQLRYAVERYPSFQIDPIRIANGEDVVEEALEWAALHIGQRPIFYATNGDDRVRAVQDLIGKAEAGRVVEKALAGLAKGLVRLGFGKLVIAGGETSGSVVGALGVSELLVGEEIAPGVPWTFSQGTPSLALALKSGNFGQENFFSRALDLLENNLPG